MNENELEAEIRKVSRDSTLDPRRKDYLIQNLMTRFVSGIYVFNPNWLLFPSYSYQRMGFLSRWIAAQQKLPQARAVGTSNGEDVLGCVPSFRDPDKQIFGCEHYKRNCKLRASCCGNLFTCRFCHDKVSDHSMDR